MKLRLLPIFISFVVSGAILFGGWFLYDSYAMQTPLTDIVQKVEGVQEANLDIQKDVVLVKLKLAPNASLREIYRVIEKDGADIVDDREIKLKVVNNLSPQLEKWWSDALFDVAEAMDTKQYSQIPKTLEQLASESAELKVESEIDDQNVYVKLTDGTISKFIILPRTPARIGVWPNE